MHPTSTIAHAQRLTGKSAIITGAAQGIGRSIAQAFVQQGAAVLLTDIREDALQRAADELGQPCMKLDVREDRDWAGAFAHVIQEYGAVDILVNNAGITGYDPDANERYDPEHVSLERWREVHQTNLDGVFLGCRHAIRAMREKSPRNASIINIGSRSGVVGVPGVCAYASSKGAVRNHTKSVALYCAEQGLPIRCNVIQPAAILTPMWDPMLGTGTARETNLKALSESCPLHRFGTPDEVAQLAVYLASDESAYTTGAEFNLDGGMLAGTASPRIGED